MMAVFGSEAMQSVRWAEGCRIVPLDNYYGAQSARLAENCMGKTFRAQHRCTCMHIKPIYHLEIGIKRAKAVIR